MNEPRFIHLLLIVVLASLSMPARAQAQAPSTTPPSTSVSPIAIVQLGDDKSGAGPTVTGALQVTAGKAVIAASGQITAGSQPATVQLPRRGSLRVCQSTSVRLASASGSSAGSAPGLMMAMDHGALEVSFADANTADVLMTPDFRIQLSGPGKADLKARVADHGDTCIDNPGGGPSVLVTSAFDGGTYSVRPGQRVLLLHGSVHEVSDSAKEPCGCPPAAAEVKGNDFPLAQSEGLAPTPAPAPAASNSAANHPATPPLVFNAPAQPVASEPSASSAAQPGVNTTAPAAKKPGVFHRMGRFFHKLFHL